MTSSDNSSALLEQVRHALDTETPLKITGGNSKASLGHQHAGQNASVLHTREHTGVISYDPTELIVTVRAGTSLEELNSTLDEAGQMLPFEPPTQPQSTIGGTLACGLSGPRRPFNGSARDYVLGMRVINGQAQDLSFGGQVMKNVAGYDVSRAQVGAWGTLGLLLDMSMKVLPKPELEQTLVQPCKHHELQAFAPLLRQPLPLSGAMLIGDERYLRLSGSEVAVRAAAGDIGGQIMEDNAIWQAVNNHTHPFFTQAFEQAANTDKTLWRIAISEYAPMIELPGEWLHEWAGGQRWLLTSVAADELFDKVAAAGGHATRYSKAGEGESAFQPLSGAMQNLQSRLRDSFDPKRIFNRGRFHPELDSSVQLAATGA